MNAQPISFKGFMQCIITTLLLFFQFNLAIAQLPSTADRVRVVEERLKNLAVTVPGLNQKVQMNVSNVSVQEFLRALAQANSLNINIDI